MSIIIVSILVYVGLLFVMIAVQSTYSHITNGIAYGFSNRTTPAPNKTALGHRIDNTFSNLKEGAVLYLPLALLALHLDVANNWVYYAALATIVSRVGYVPVYIVGLEKVRSFVFLPSLLAIPMLMYGIYLGIG